jgi:CubicO group peptidase (beta-lactamase class C family)
MINKIYLRLLVSLALVFSLITISLPQIGYAQSSTTAKTAASDDLQKRLARIEEKVEARRKELGIPGMSLAIVKDGEVVLSKGFGYKNFEKQIPVTSDTQFAIGSATKAFTALSVLISQDEGKLSLDESPKKYLPYFKINDAEIDKNITVKDLLTHSSGLNRTDLAWITGKLTREEIIKVAGEAKPVAKLGEKFLYQNVMYTTAGEIVSKVQKMPWEKFVAQDILKPIGMINSSVSIAEMQKAKDYSFGYEFNFDTKETRLLPTREILAVSPAGSINSTSNDMAKWLQFILNKGEINGKRLVSEKSFEQWIKPEQKIAGNFFYALGWFVQDWKGKKVIQHGGNIDGFNSMVALIPEENIGFVMLTNVSASSLGDELMPIVWENMLEDLKDESSNQAVSAEAKKEIGKYKFPQAGFDIEVTVEEGKLVAKVPGQPTYILEKIEGRKYKFANAPGFFMTFKDDSAYLEQPQGNYTLPKEGAENKVKSSESAKELVGKYESQQNKGSFIEIKDVDGNVSLVVGNQPPYPLVEKEKNIFSSPNLPDSYSVKIKRGAEKKIEGLILSQPEGEFLFDYIGETEKNASPKITAEELMPKVIAALGGEDNLRKINSRVTKFEIDLVHQGIKGTGMSYAEAPFNTSTEITITALGKKIGTITDYFNGTGGGEITSFSRNEIYTGQRLQDIKYGADFYGLLDWKNDTQSIEITRTEKIGDEEVYVVKVQPKEGNTISYRISTKTFLPVKLISVVVSSTSSQKIPIVTTMSDYREVDGIMLPFKVVSENPGMGDIVIYTKEVKHNVPIDDAKFKARKN